MNSPSSVTWCPSTKVARGSRYTGGEEPKRVRPRISAGILYSSPSHQSRGRTSLATIFHLPDPFKPYGTRSGRRPLMGTATARHLHRHLATEPRLDQGLPQPTPELNLATVSENIKPLRRQRRSHVTLVECTVEVCAIEQLFQRYIPLANCCNHRKMAHLEVNFIIVYTLND